MIVRNLEEVLGSPREVHAENWTSRRLVLAEDRVGFSLHDTVLAPGTSTHMWYRHHVEAVYCVGGRGQLTNHETGEVHPIAPGTLYVLDGHEKHVLTAETQLRMICVFTPPLVGTEVHGPDGAYPLLTLGDRPHA